MAADRCLSSSRLPRLTAVLSAAAIVITSASVFGAASPPPGPSGANARWNNSSSLKPHATTPILEDYTWWAGSEPQNGNVKEFYSLDIENGMLFAATGQGIEVIDIRNGPTGDEDIYLFGYDFPAWSYAGDSDWYAWYLDAPAGNSNVVAVSFEQQGLAVVRSSNANDWSSPVVAYHAKGELNPATQTMRVYAVRAAGTDWAYALNLQSKLVRFNLSATATMNRCLDLVAGVTCPGVFKGEVTAVGGGWQALGGVGNFMATGTWQGGGTIKIWGLTDPAAPTELMRISSSRAMGLAMWQAGGSTYLARIDHISNTLTIHNVSCIANGPCSSAPVVFSQTLASSSALTQVTVSQDAGKTYLYVGGEDQGSCAPQREYVFDATNPGSATDLTPHIHPDGYWGWYYQHCPTGFNLVGTRSGQVYGNVFYRAAATLLDAHQLAQSGPPTAAFTWTPTTDIYPGTSVQFTDQSGGTPTSWSWSFQDGSPPTSTSPSPTVSFATAGTKGVTLNVTNQFGLGTPASHNINVLDPTPHADSLSVTPAAPIVCQPVTLTAVNPGGQPTLQYQWVVEDTSGPVFSQTNGNSSQVWNTAPQGQQPAAAPGNYTAKVTITTNSAPGSVVKTAAFTLLPTPALPGNGQFAPTTLPFTAGTVTFDVVAPGATEWNWDFDGDGVFNESDWTSNPVSGPHPTHVYSTIGVRNVRVKVRNCVDQVGTLSAAVEVNITQITPLNALFAISGGASCLPGIPACSVSAGAPVTFRDLSTGAELWDFDWNGDGSFEQANLDASDFENSELGPTISHVFATAGEFTPRLRVRRGSSEQSIYTLDKSIVVGSATPSGVNVSGPSSGLTGAALTFTASPTGSCSPATSGWSWQLAGGAASGSTSGSTVTVTWSSTGSKTISASNSGCPGATDSLTVTISNPTQGSPLQAAFTFSPAAPQSGQPVTFNGASSTGSPTDYTWSFGDGASGSGPQAAHTYGTAGAYTVQLMVAKVGSGCSPFCQSSVSKVVTVTGAAVPHADFTYSPGAPKAGEVVSFNSSSSTNVPAGSTYAWEFGDGTTGSGPTALHSFATAGTFQVRLSIAPTGCTALSCVVATTKPVAVAAGGGPAFTVTPAVLGAGEVIVFDSSPSTNVNPASSFTWDFGDGTPPRIGRLVTHVFAQPSTYNVVLAVAAPGCQAVACLGVAAKQIVVGPAPAVTANYTADVFCQDLTCQAQTGKAVRLTANATDATTYSWNFGDGSTGTGREVWHAWDPAGSYAVSLSVAKGTASGSLSRTFAVTGEAPLKKPMQLLPLVLATNSPLLQSSDLYVHNPGDAGIGVVLELRRNSQPEADPPRVHASLAPGATLLIGDVLRKAFNLENVAGYIAVTTEGGDVEPVSTVLGLSGRQANSLFGLGVNGATVANGGLAYLTPPPNPAQHLAWLGDTSERQSSLVLSNPSDQPATYRLRFFDGLGNALGASTDLLLDRFAQRRLAVEELRSSFGVAGANDYRVEIDSISGPPLFSFATDLRTATGDLSAITPGTYDRNRLYLLGVSSGKLGSNKWQTDLLFANVGDQSAQVTFSYAKGIGQAATKAASPVTLAAGESRRIDNALLTQLGVNNGTGVLTISSTSAGDVYPVAAADTYDNTNAQKRFGQRIPALSDADAAAAGQALALAGLRQGAGNVATLWIFNPSGAAGQYNVICRGLDGKVLSTRTALKVAAGQVRQLTGADFGIKQNRGANGFSVEIAVTSGSAVAAAQVSRKGSTDPAYIVGARR